MSAINSDHPIPLSPYYKESAIMYGAAGAFVLVSFALAFLAANYAPIGVAGYSTITSIDIASFVVFASALIKRNRKIEVEIQEEIKKAEAIKEKNIDTNEETIDVDAASQSSFMVDLKKDLIPVMDGFEKILISLTNAYYRSEKKTPKALDGLKQGMAILKNTVNAILSDQKQLLRFAVALMAVNFVDQQKLKKAFSKTSEEFLRSLPFILYDSKDIDETAKEQLRVAKSIFTALANKGTIRDHKSVQLLQNLKEKHEKMEMALVTAKELKGTSEYEIAYNVLEEKEKEYNKALSTFFDHLFLMTSFESKELSDWFDQTIPCYLNEIKELIFRRMSSLILWQISLAYQEGGFLNRTAVIAIIYGATTIVGRKTVVMPLIDHKLEAAPLNESYKKDLYKALDFLLPSLSNPIYYGTCSHDHSLREKLAQFFTSKDFKAPNFPPLEEKNFAFGEYLQTYASYLEQLAKQIDAFAF